MTLKTVLTAQLDATFTNALDLATVSFPVAYKKKITLTSGTGANNADLVFTDTRTLAASANEDLDLAGSLSSANGVTLTFVELKGLLIVAAAGNTNNVRVTRPASNGVPIFLAASDGIDVRPGGFFYWANPGDGGVAVTASTGDLINIANSSSGTSVTYDVIIIGTSA